MPDASSADPSTSTFVSSIVFNVVIATVLMLCFGIARKISRRIYAPRTYLVSEKRRSPDLPTGIFSWIPALLFTKDVDMRRRMGLDRYMFIRLLRMGIILFAICTLFCIPILIPLNVIDGIGSPGINIMTIGNVKYSGRTWAHAWLAVLVSALTIWMTYRETRRYIQFRHEYLLSSDHANTPTARTILVAGIPAEYNTEEALLSLFNKYPGGVKQIWLNRKVKGLPKKVDKRFKMVKGLEGASLKAMRKTMAPKDGVEHSAQVGVENGSDSIPEQFRPTHRVSPLPIPLPCVGKKVDSISYYEDQIVELNGEIDSKQNEIGSYRQVNSAFIEFNEQIAAHMASQTLAHHKIMTMQPRYIEIAPEDIEWKNMNINPWSRLLRQFISYCITGAIIIFWAIPVAFVSAIANLDTLVSLLPFLAPVNNLPTVALGVIQGVLPAVALAILMALPVIFFTMLSRLEGIPRKSSIELAVLHKYFAFQFVNVVLVSTIAGGVLQSASTIFNNPGSIVGTLANKLPQAATFFITYVMLQATIPAAMELLQIVPLILSWVFAFLASTPRSIYGQRGNCPQVNLGTLIPSHTVIFVLGLLYSCIAPLVLPFVLLFFCTKYFVYVHQFLYVYGREVESGGQCYPKAIRHIYTGLFLFQLTMIGILALQGGATGQYIIMIICIVVTAFAMFIYDRTFKPMLKYLPSSLANPAVPYDLREDSTPEGAASDSVNTHPRQKDLERGPGYEKHDQHVAHHIDHEDGDNDEEHDEDTYKHPAFITAQPTVWLPQDDQGLAQRRISEMESKNIKATTDGAQLPRNKKGKPGRVVLDEDRFSGEHPGVPYDDDKKILAKLNPMRNTDAHEPQPDEPPAQAPAPTSAQAQTAY
ncbi:hypothetical protein INT43_006391 [Umbelopsis isabellina]|uniref:DUF221-domain-containing protein n=1 Tax=Mortierella isabellina TaxID=91625 RepID=A0A8H7Q0P8_MORIS|nr:hypothetical protein INT43_006391 [Umbelopsis isabellina]